MTKYRFPCKNCITLAMCKMPLKSSPEAQVKKIEELCRKCSFLNNFISNHPYFDEETKKISSENMSKYLNIYIKFYTFDNRITGWSISQDE